jgi:hypothetical protein
MRRTPEILFHWLPPSTLSTALREDHLPGLWRHWLPREGRQAYGVCLGVAPAWWHTSGSDACIALHAEPVAEASEGRWFNSQRIWRFGLEMDELPPDERKARCSEENMIAGVFEAEPTELFIEGGLDGFIAHAAGAAVIGEPDSELAALCRRTGIGLKTLHPAVADDHELLEMMAVRWCTALPPLRRPEDPAP